MDGKLVVVRFVNGVLRKGLSLDVNAQSPRCHLRTESEGTIEIPLRDLKALFFVKTLEGRPEYQETKTPVPGDPRLVGTKQVRVRFSDGEELVGLMNRFPPNTSFFFVLPIDPESNNIRVLANRAFVDEMGEL